jgi:hypothetical protein
MGGDINFYNYVRNNPVNLNDASGLIAPAIPIAIVIVEAISEVAVVAWAWINTWGVATVVVSGTAVLMTGDTTSEKAETKAGTNVIPGNPPNDPCKHNHDEQKKAEKLSPHGSLGRQPNGDKFPKASVLLKTIKRVPSIGDSLDCGKLKAVMVGLNKVINYRKITYDLVQKGLCPKSDKPGEKENHEDQIKKANDRIKEYKKVLKHLGC